MKKLNNTARCGGALLLCLGLAQAAHAGEEAFALCAEKYPDSNAERLKCYDDAVAAVPPRAAADVALPQPATQMAADEDEDEDAAPAAPEPAAAGRSYLTRAWNLDNKTNLDQSKLGRLVPHRQSYLLVHTSNNVNSRPASPAPATARSRPSTSTRWRPSSS